MTKYNTNVNRMVCCPSCGDSFVPTQYDMKMLTPKQLGVLTFLRDYIATHNVAPSFQEIADGFGYKSLATVHEHMTILERKGYILRSYNASRAIVIVEQAV